MFAVHSLRSTIFNKEHRCLACFVDHKNSGQWWISMNVSVAHTEPPFTPCAHNLSPCSFHYSFKNHAWFFGSSLWELQTGEFSGNGFGLGLSLISIFFTTDCWVWSTKGNVKGIWNSNMNMYGGGPFWLWRIPCKEVSSMRELHHSGSNQAAGSV